MSRHYRVQIYWPGRTDTVRTMAGQVAAFLAELATIHPGFARFVYEDGQRKLVPVKSEDDCAAALAQRTVRWKTGEVLQTSYQPRFFVDRKAGAPVEVAVTCGIEPTALDGVFVPNRLELLVRADIGDERASRPVLEAAIRSAVSVFRPDFGFVGTESVPSAPIAVFSDGTPVVGWMTYLRAAFPPIPRTLPTPAVAYPVKDLGTLIIAHPELFHELDPAQRASMERVREALKAAEVLVPSTRLPKQS
ncbi:MAG: Imm52 family immunity protein [Byssovorax sp.]